MTKSPVIAAIDAGTGFTKFSKLRPGRHADIEVFPSLTDIAFHDSRSSCLRSPRRNALIPFGTHLVEVGPDIKAALGDAIYHSQAEGFAATDDYRACVAGALAFIEEPFIDMLVLTVPMREREALEPQIRDWLSRPVRTAANTSVTVARVEVLAQAAASAIEWFDSPEIDEPQVSLVLVAGFGSLDWALYRGRDLEALAGGTEYHGVANLLRTVDDRIGQGAPSGDGRLDALIKRFAKASPCGRADNCMTCSFTGRGSMAGPPDADRHHASPDRTAEPADRVAGRWRRSLLPAGRGRPVRSTGRARGRRADARVRAWHVPVRQALPDGRSGRPARLIHRDANRSHPTPHPAREAPAGTTVNLTPLATVRSLI